MFYQASVVGNWMSTVHRVPNTRVLKRAGQVAGQAGLRIRVSVAHAIVASVEHVTKVTMDISSFALKTFGTRYIGEGRGMTQLTIKRFGASDVSDMRALNALFGRCFEDRETYEGTPPDNAYLESVLSKPHVIALGAYLDGTLCGGLVGYELEKLEQARSEIYIYDLAVEEGVRRQGVATALIESVSEIARARGAWVSFVQADYVDAPAVALYEKLGLREEVLHFDIPPNGKPAG